MDCQYLSGSVPTLVLNVDRVKSFDNLRKPDVVQRYVVQRYGAAVVAVASALRPCGLQLAASAAIAISFCIGAEDWLNARGKVAGPKRAAAKLGIPRSTLHSKIKQLKIKKHKLNDDQ